MWLRTCPLAMVLAIAAVAQQAPVPGPRKALLIGNRAYQTLPPLSTAVNDAKAVGAALADTGFSVKLLQDLDKAKLAAEFNAFLDTVNSGDTVVFYFSGYGLQLESENYLLPTGFNPRNVDNLDEEGYSVRRFQTFLQRKKAGLKILILDACYTAPALSALGSGRGLASPFIEDPESDVALPALPGKTIADTPGQPNSLFVKELVSALRKPGLTPEQLFDEVGRRVRLASNGTQAPQQNSNVLREFYFRAPLPVEVKPPTPVAPVAPVITDYHNATDDLTYVKIPKGEFQMGCVPGDTACAPDEKQHKVTLTHDFWMSSTEVPVSSYRLFSAAGLARVPPLEMFDKQTQKRLKGQQFLEPEGSPIINVTWVNANAFCEWAGGRLPTEAEWEYSARGGVPNQIYPWGNTLTHNDANFIGRDGYDTWEYNSPATSFKKNGFGLFNMAGNAGEWVADFYDPQYYSTPAAAVDPKGPAAGAEKVVRGGNSQSQPPALRTSARAHFPPSTMDRFIGFRCAIDQPKHP